jgi:hypothetical protein
VAGARSLAPVAAGICSPVSATVTQRLSWDPFTLLKPAVSPGEAGYYIAGSAVKWTCAEQKRMGTVNCLY